MIRILVVDDQRLVRRCIGARLNAVEDFEVAAEAASGEQACDIVRTRDIDVVLMDLNMPGIGGLGATRRLVSSTPGCRVVGLSMYVDGPYPLRFMELGGAGYVSKDADADELVDAIRAVASGKPYISSDVAANIAVGGSTRGVPGALAGLSAREVEVLHKIAGGLGIDEIAAALCLSPKTIAHHRRALFDKLGARNDVQLAMIAQAGERAAEGADVRPDPPGA